MASLPTGIKYFSTDYFQARDRFVEACLAADFGRHEATVDADSPAIEPLTIEVGVAGNPQPERALVVSSGVHGVEAPLGAALQLALIDQWRSQPARDDGMALILVHTLNPYGAAWNRRFNEHNVDLNRNFMSPGQPYAGEPPLARRFRDVLGPSSTPDRISASLLRMAALAARHGHHSFWETLPVGQYEHPDWLFYGGRELSRSGKFLRQFLPEVLRDAQQVVHLDFHTGLGRWGCCELLLSEGEKREEVAWWQKHFPVWQVVEANNSGRYVVRGGFGPWLQSVAPHCEYHYTTAEFGTYAAWRVLIALAEENRWTRMQPDLPPDHWSRKRLAEAFAPRSKAWRTSTHTTGLRLAQEALDVLAR